jgi:hypothetical protein
MKQLETLGPETDESPREQGELVEVTPEQLAHAAESAAAKNLAEYVVPFGVELAEEIDPTVANNTTATSTNTSTTGQTPGRTDWTRDKDW